MNDHDPTSVAISISSYLRKQYPIPVAVVGARLGSEIQLSFPHINLKVTFGGLRTLINNYLQPFVREIGRSGSDFRYQIDFSQPHDSGPTKTAHETDLPPATERTEPESSPYSTSPKHGGSEVQANASTNLWAALTNPKVAVPARWDAQENNLIIGGDSSVDAALPTLHPIGFEDHRAITQEYLDQKRIVLPATVADPGDLSSYVPRVASWLRKEGLISDWEGYRTNAILKILENRLQKIGATNPQVYAILSKIRDAKPRGPWFSKLATPKYVSASPQIASGEQKLREFFMTAVKLMPIEELRELKVNGATIEKTLALL